MTAALKSCLLVPLLLWAFLLPKVTALLLDFHPGVQMTVICTGTEMVTLRIGPDGQPIEVEHTEDTPCLMADPSSLASPDAPDWTTLARSYTAPFIAIPTRAARHDPNLINRESQGPPFA